MKDQVDAAKAILTKLRGAVSKQMVTKLDLDKWERMVEKLASFSVDCQECQQKLSELTIYLTQLEANAGRLEKADFKKHREVMNEMAAHLQKNHKLMPEGYYLAIFMCLGLSMGVSLGLAIFDNISLGISIGMSMGVAIGVGLDADAKKKGKTF